MDRESSLLLLRRLLDSRLLTQTSIGNALGIHPSQVSRICAGHFRRLDGNARRVCNYAQSFEAQELGGLQAGAPTDEWGEKFARLQTVKPQAALAVQNLVDALLETP